MQILETLWLVIILTTFAGVAFCWLWLTVEAFRKHYLWGLAVLLFPASQLVFAALHWDRARKPILFGLVTFAALFFELIVSRGWQAFTS